MTNSTTYQVDIPPGLLSHSLSQLDRSESERLIGAQAGIKPPISSEEHQASYATHTYSLKTSSDRANRRNNRWANIFTFDHSLLPGDYLNASLIPPYPCDECPPRRSYIASQAPLPHALPTFYAAIMKYKVPLIVNLTAFTDHGQVKSDQYWPLAKDKAWDTTQGYRIEHRDDPKSIGDRHTNVCPATHYQLRLSDTEQTHDFELLHITSWPDFGSFSNNIFASLLSLIDETAKGKEGPTLVHCSAGIGRSGTVIASLLARDLGSSLPRALKLKPMTTPSLIAEGALKAAQSMVDHERRFRPKMVQTANQLGMVAYAIGDLLQRLK